MNQNYDSANAPPPAAPAPASIHSPSNSTSLYDRQELDVRKVDEGAQGGGILMVPPSSSTSKCGDDGGSPKLNQKRTGRDIGCGKQRKKKNDGQEIGTIPIDPSSNLVDEDSEDEETHPSFVEEGGTERARSSGGSNQSMTTMEVGESTNPRKHSQEQDSIAMDVDDEIEIDVGFHSFHAWVLWRMTKSYPSATIRDKVIYYTSVYLTPLLSWLVLFLQLLILDHLVDQARYPTCKAGSEDCEHRQQVCSVDFEGEYNFGEQVGLCINQPDSPDGHCSFLESIVMPKASKLIIAVVYVYILAALLTEMNQNNKATQAARHLAHHNNRGFWTNLNVWAFHWLRTFSMPTQTILAVASVLYTDVDFRPSTILLNGVAVEIVTRFDDYLFQILLPESSQRKVAVEMGKAKHEREKEPNQLARNKAIWWMNRIYSLGLSVVAVAFVIEPIATVMIHPSFTSFFFPKSYELGYVDCAELFVYGHLWFILVAPFWLLDLCLQCSNFYTLLGYIIGSIFASAFVVTVWPVSDFLYPHSDDVNS